MSAPLPPTDRERVHELWTASSQRLHAWFRRRTGDANEADDLVQETFLRVQRDLASLRDDGRLAAWVGAIAANVLADRGRARRKAVASLDGDAGTDVDAGALAAPDGEPALTTAVAGWLDAFLASLAPDDAALLRAVDLDGRAQSEVAAELGLSPSGARSRVQRARVRLRERLEACCRFAFDRRGNVLDATRRSGARCDCDGG